MEPGAFLKERTRAGRLLEVEEFCSEFTDREAEILGSLRRGDSTNGGTSASASDKGMIFRRALLGAVSRDHMVSSLVVAIMAV